MAWRGTCWGVVGAAMLAGCAQGPVRRAMDPADAARMHSVLVVQPPNQKRFDAGIAQPPIVGASVPPALAALQFGALLIAMADAQQRSTELTAAVGPAQVRVQERLGEMLRAGLAADGLEARVVVLPALGDPLTTPPWQREQALADVLPALREHGPADAALVFLLEAKVTRDPGGSRYCAAVDVSARGLDLASGAALYENSLEYGCAPARAGWQALPCAAECRFDGFDAVLADPARVRAAWEQGLRLIADAILADVRRGAPP